MQNQSKWWQYKHFGLVGDGNSQMRSFKILSVFNNKGWIWLLYSKIMYKLGDLEYLIFKDLNNVSLLISLSVSVVDWILITGKIVCSSNVDCKDEILLVNKTIERSLTSSLIFFHTK